MVIHDPPPERALAWTVPTLLGRNLLTICVNVGGSLALTQVARHSAHGDRELESEDGVF